MTALLSAVPDMKAGLALLRADMQAQRGTAAGKSSWKTAAPGVSVLVHQDLLRAQRAEQPRRQWDVL